MLKIEVLPAPFGPIMVNISPGSTAKLTPSTAVSPPKRSEMVVEAEQAHRLRSDLT